MWLALPFHKQWKSFTIVELYTFKNIHLCIHIHLQYNTCRRYYIVGRMYAVIMSLFQSHKDLFIGIHFVYLASSQWFTLSIITFSVCCTPAVPVFCHPLPLRLAPLRHATVPKLKPVHRWASVSACTTVLWRFCGLFSNGTHSIERHHTNMSPAKGKEKVD